MKLIKATITSGKVTTDSGENIPTGDVVILAKTKDGMARQGFVIIDEDKTYFIDTEIITKLQLPILDLLIQTINQIALSVTASKSTILGSPIETTIAADLQPFLLQLTTLKEEI